MVEAAIILSILHQKVFLLMQNQNDFAKKKNSLQPKSIPLMQNQNDHC